MWLKAVKAPNAQALAARIGADPAKLQASIASANAAAQGAGEDAFGKSADMRHALQGPLLALDISMGNPLFPLATLSLGGLRVDEDSGQVLDATGQAIPGLPAGRTAIGLASRRYISGLSLADCVFWRRAGCGCPGASFRIKTVFLVATLAGKRKRYHFSTPPKDSCMGHVENKLALVIGKMAKPRWCCCLREGRARSPAT